VFVDQHRFDADPDPNFHVHADPNPNRHKNDADSHADTCLYMLENLNYLTLFSHSIASLQYFIFLIIVKYFNILEAYKKFFGKKYRISQLFHWLVIDTYSDRPDPDQHTLDADPNPDPAK
jgi:hypothetical protein